MSKKYLVLILMASFMLILASCGSTEDSNENSGADKEATNDDGLDTSVTLHMLEAGGKSGEFVQRGFIDPFVDKTGIEVLRESPTSLGKVQSMVKSGNITLDLVEFDESSLEQAHALGLLEELDWDLIDPDPIFEEAQLPYAVGYQYFNTVMAWNEDVIKGEGPQSWADFWDVEKFPGKRSLSDYSVFTLPIALLADGVKPEELYPLDLDRAFKSLDKIKDHVSIWWESGAQPTQALIANEIDYAGMWGAGLIDNEEGIDYSFNQALLNMAYFAVPKGAKNIPETMALLHEFTIAENQVNALEVIPTAGASKELESYLSEEMKKVLPTTAGNYEKHVLSNPKWWLENVDEVTKRWQEFQLSR